MQHTDSSHCPSTTPAAAGPCPPESHAPHSRTARRSHRLAVHLQHHVARLQARIVRRSTRTNIRHRRAFHFAGTFSCCRASGVRSSTASPSLPVLAPPAPRHSQRPAFPASWYSPTFTPISRLTVAHNSQAGSSSRLHPRSPQPAARCRSTIFCPFSSSITSPLFNPLRLAGESGSHLRHNRARRILQVEEAARSPASHRSC